MNRPKEKPPAGTPTTKTKRKEGDLKHVLETGLPPGVDLEDARDPGSQTPPVPADNRS